MAKIIKFRMEQAFREHFVRDYEFSSDATLFDVNNFIREELGYDILDLTTISLTDKEGNIVKSYDTILVADEKSGELIDCTMSITRLSDIITSADCGLIWSIEVMDLENDTDFSVSHTDYFLKPIDVMEPKPEFSYPRVAFAHGEPLGGDEDEDYEDEKSIFEEMMDDFGDFGGDDSYDDEY